MANNLHFLIQKKGQKTKINFHKDLYSLDSLKEAFSKVSSLKNTPYWQVWVDSSPLKNILEQYNYLLYLNRKR